MSNGGSYDPRLIEPEIYKFWEEGGYFHAEPDTNPDPARRRKPYVIDIPLPNVTGSLHLGHALNNTIQDVLIRYKRMCGFNAMWMPGMDHAGIATQAVVEKKLKEEQNLTRHELGREGLVKKIWEWKEEYGGRILRQLRRIGSSCDWERARFTLDEVCAKAVYEAFFRLFKDGLIYRGLRLVNWDAHLQTAVADDEIVHETVQGHLWHYRYPIVAADPRVGRSDVAADPRVGRSDVAADPRVGRSDALDPAALDAIIKNAARPDAKPGVDYLVVATTRPETMLGDTAVAVHPEDERYKPLIGKNCLLPLANRPIPIIADGLLVKKEFGTGCVKVTPGHDPNDYACGLRNNLPTIDLLTLDGRINENGGKDYAGLTYEEARKKVVKDLEALGLMEKVEPYQHEVGHSDRSKTPIQPMRSEQWFVKMADLCELAMGAVRDGRVKFFPERYANTYLDWLGEKRDWCISRQLWWGHRIPVWKVTLRKEATQEQDEGECNHAQTMRDRFFEVFDTFAKASKIAGDVAVVQQEGRKRDFHICARSETALKELELFYNRNYKSGYKSITDPDDLVLSLSLDDPRYKPEQLLRQIIRHMDDRDSDVLDTWFSSALWPFSTLRWPDPNPDLDYFYPTSTLVTAREIITLWVARMVMTSLYFNKVVPFDHVHIHPNIQDGQGRRMSKSAGNGVDPVDLIELYGTDAMRFTLAQMSTETQDIRMPVAYLCPHCGGLTPQESVVPKNKVPSQIHKATCHQCKKPFATIWANADLKKELGTARDTSDKFEIGRNLSNKLWQAATGFVFPNIHSEHEPSEHEAQASETVVRSSSFAPRPLNTADLAIEDLWILARLATCINEVDRRFAKYQLNEIANTLYAFFWSDFCDWYVELVKPRLSSRDAEGVITRHDDASANTARQVLAWVLDQTLRLMHPIMPFVTEELWHRLNEIAPQRGLSKVEKQGEALIVARWPDAAALPRQAGVEDEMQTLQSVIRAVRDIRTHVNIIRSASKEKALRTLPRAVVKADEKTTAMLNRRLPMLQRLGQCDAFEIGPDQSRPADSMSTVLAGGLEVYVPIAGLADLAVERKRLGKERDELAGHIARLEGKLGNEGFVAKAPADVVERERARLAELKEKLAAVERNLAEVGG